MFTVTVIICLKPTQRIHLLANISIGYVDYKMSCLQCLYECYLQRFTQTLERTIYTYCGKIENPGPPINPEYSPLKDHITLFWE